MTARHQKLGTDLELIENLLNKEYAGGKGLDSGTRDHLLRRKLEIEAQLKTLENA